jgi:cell division protein ZapA
MQTNQNIKIFIAGRPYKITIKSDEEELVRKAADTLNDTIKKYSQSFEYKDQQDLFAMIALQHVANSIRLEDVKSFKDEKMNEKLSEIDQILSLSLETGKRSLK